MTGHGIGGGPPGTTVELPTAGRAGHPAAMQRASKQRASIGPSEPIDGA